MLDQTSTRLRVVVRAFIEAKPGSRYNGGVSSGRLRDVGYRLDALQWADRLIREAKQRVSDHLPQSPARTLMMDMADAVLTREC